MNVIIREFQEKDLDDIKEIILNAENFGPEFLVSELELLKVYKTFPDYGRVLVAYGTERKKAFGFASIRFSWRSLTIRTIITHRKHLKQGIGRKLINEIVKIGENHPKINVIRVDTGDFMKYAQIFYLSCGFQISGYVSHDLSWNNHQVHFSLPLKEKSKD